MKDGCQNSEVDMLNFHLSVTSVFRFAKDRDPALRARRVAERGHLLKEVLGVMGSDGVRKAKNLFLKVGAVYLGPHGSE